MQQFCFSPYKNALIFCSTYSLHRALFFVFFFLHTPLLCCCSKVLSPMRKGWFSIIGNNNVLLWCREGVCSWVLTKLGGFETGFLVRLMKKTFVALFTCSLALGGATVGTIYGAIKGQTTETGFLRGAGIGAVAGAITAVQFMELTAQGESFSKVALLLSLINGKVFREWVTPAVLKAYQWQISALEASSSENFDIFEINGGGGLSDNYIAKLPKDIFSPSKRKRPGHVTSCIICLEDFKKGDLMRVLPSCGHSFHLGCIDEWLIIHGSCPVCRTDV